VARTPELALVFNPAVELNIEQGWYAPAYGIKHPAPVVSIRVDESSQADFFTLVVPLKPDRQTPSFQVRAQETETSTILEVSNLGPDGLTTDVVVWGESGGDFALESFHCGASAAWLRRSAEQASLIACNVRELARASGGKELLFENENPVRWIMWDEQGGITLDDGREL
jgi:hypothetical protein